MSKESQILDPAGMCAHAAVIRVCTDENTYYKDEWTCRDCKEQFFHIDWTQRGKITLAEPTPTLRDQFAMSVLNGWISCDASGTSYWKADAQMEEVAHNAYAWANAMIKARG